VAVAVFVVMVMAVAVAVFVVMVMAMAVAVVMAVVVAVAVAGLVVAPAENLDRFAYYRAASDH
jgi:UPF0716 family protein affecting phage T7 exclusion